jgi:TolB-like protein
MRKVVYFPATATGPDSGDPVIFYLNRIVSSKPMTGSAALKKLLVYLVMKTRSSEHEIKEYSLGTEVFGRGEKFDPHLDTIVRVQMRRLREKLARYYSTEGREDLIHIEIPRGSYVPEIVHFSARRCLAILPFMVFCQEKSCHQFADALTEMLIDDLARPGSLDVISRTFANGYKDGLKDVGQIATQLNVDAILEGSVQHDDRQFRTTIRLVNARTGFSVWSGKLNVDSDNVLKGGEEISRSVVPVLRDLIISTPAPLSRNSGSELR